jgi:hypothetical protein
MHTSLFLFLGVLLISSTSHASIFGYSDATECMQKNYPKLKFEPARDLLLYSCALGYNPDLNQDLKKSGRCIVSKINDLYSYDSTLKVINRCVGENVGHFRFYKGLLDR